MHQGDSAALTLLPVAPSLLRSRCVERRELLLLLVK